MNKQELMKAVNNIKRGQFVRVGYTTDLESKVAASCRPLYKVEKVAHCTFRFGVNWSHTKKHIEREAARTEPKKEYVSKMVWDIPNIMKHHSETQREYVVLANAAKNNAWSEFKVTELSTGKVMRLTKEQLKNMGIMQPSYFKPGDGDGVSIPIENVQYIRTKTAVYGKIYIEA